MYTVIMLWYSTRLFSKLIFTQSVMVGCPLVRREFPIYGGPHSTHSTELASLKIYQPPSLERKRFCGVSLQNQKVWHPRFAKCPITVSWIILLA